jgi:uncharacterized protein with HEPN domain
MADRTIFRLQDIISSINKIDALLEETGFEVLYNDHVARAAFERFLEILSEASRYIPEAMKADEPSIPWPKVAGIGNHLRHAYHRVDFEILWNIWANGELAELKDAIERMIAKLSD